MARSNKAVKPDPAFVPVNQVPDECDEVTVARTVLRPSVTAAVTIHAFDKSSDVAALVEMLEEQITANHNGDMIRPEAMLLAQARTLDALFGALSHRARANMGEYLGATEIYLKLALRAQSQCRTTLGTLSEMKNPRPISYVGQANIAAGHQQVSNPAPPSRAGEIENEQTKVLGQTDGEQLDTGATGAAGGVDSPIETVGAVHRPGNG